MDDLLSYSLTDFLPFSRTTYLPLNWAAGYAAAAFAVQGLLLVGFAPVVAGPWGDAAAKLHADRIGIGLLAIAVFDDARLLVRVKSRGVPTSRAKAPE